MLPSINTVRVERQSLLHKKLCASSGPDGYVVGMHFKTESGQRLRSARKAKALTLDELAATTGLGASRISNYEQGLRYMDPDVAHHLARVLGVRASWLMCVDDDDNMTPAERALLLKFRQTDKRGKQMIQSVADTQPTVTGPPDDRPTTPTFRQGGKAA